MGYTIYDPSRDCDITTPRGMRITDGPELVEWEQPWAPDAIFFRVEDLDYGTVKYCTQTEAHVLTGCSINYLWKKTVERGKKRRLYLDRYYVDPVPKDIFVSKTGRKMRTVTTYKYSY